MLTERHAVTDKAESWAIQAQETEFNTGKALVYAVLAASFVWLLGLLVFYPDRAVRRAAPVVGLVLVASLLAIRVTALYPRLGWWVWLVFIDVAVYMGAWSFQSPLASFCFVLVPLMATLAKGTRDGLVSLAISAVLLWAAKQSPWMPPLATVPQFGAGAAVVVMIGVVARYGWVGLASSTHKAYVEARRVVEQTRQTKVLLMQTREDLELANRELARLSDRQKALTIAADEARRTKEAFVANVSHELRTPLNMIIGFADMIPEASRVYGTRLPAPLLADISAIRRNSQHLASLVDDVLDLAQVDSGRMTLSREWVSLSETIGSAVSAVRALYESKDLLITLEIPDGLPDVFCDASRVRQVVLNLLSNAGRFTDRGGVTVTASLDDQDVVVSVADTGPGIAIEDRERILEPFQQVDESIRRRHGGSGLGLAISKNLVEMHGGSLWVDSELGVGSVFSFSLPRGPNVSGHQRGNDPVRWFSPYSEYAFRGRTRRSVASAPAVGPRLVILDKGESLGQMLGRYMQDAEIVTASAPQAAQAEVNRVPTDALVVNSFSFSSERDMPMSFDLPKETPQIVCRVAGSDQAARELGVVKYLVKPLSRDKLLEAVSEVVDDSASILLVDDQPEVLQLFARMLASAERGYTVLRATNGQRALDLLRKRQPDIAIVDLVMPGMDGYDLLSRKREDTSINQIPVIVVSSTDQSGHRVVSNRITVSLQSELSLVDLVNCIKNSQALLGRSLSQADPEKREAPPV